MTLSHRLALKLAHQRELAELSAGIVATNMGLAVLAMICALLSLAAAGVFDSIRILACGLIGTAGAWAMLRHVFDRHAMSKLDLLVAKHAEEMARLSDSVTR